MIERPVCVEPCCPAGKCDYSPERVQHHLTKLLDMEAAGEDACLRSNTQRYDSEIGGNVGDGNVSLWDVKAAVQTLRRRGKEVSAVSVATALCPWSLDS